ncbi:Phenol hydroxylase P5 protein [Hartmannibacter diazotrophicus]|uniref:Phenol hydroxylase P5 protein n=1 Tax=Hartmannibacter diazotrophicus TaxID=1482074 RepID=A0A2C9D6I6_9HYPH|nr:ferredoxin reductase family protein [Hartmannibacter diazotrophicus]SON55125.1 Phenol hydroxylase P5 protein [Hartmannibacter diazotrophicus]
MSTAAPQRPTTTCTGMPERREGLSGGLLALIYAAVVLGTAAVFDVYRQGNPAHALSSAFGAASLAMFLGQFVTSGRFEGISGRIGLDVTMGFHRMAAMVALLFAVLHVLLLPLRMGNLDPERLLVRLGRMLTAPGNLTGILALILFAFLIVMARSFRGRRGLRYEVWRLTHGIGGVLSVLLLAHHLAIKSHTAVQPIPAVFLIVLGVLAVGALAVVYVVRPKAGYGLGFVVEETRRRGPSVVELTLRQTKPRGWSFRAGQFAWIAIGGRHTITDNPFSIASAPEDLPRLSFLIREAGDRTRQIIDLPKGTPVAVDGPHGNFVEARPAEAVVMIAGGIGIAPIRSLLRSAAARGDRRRYRLVYAARTVDDLVAAKELADLSAYLDLDVRMLVEDGPAPQNGASGRVDAARVHTLLEGLDPAATLAFVCGPPPMMDATVDMLLKEGLGARHIVMERFDYDVAGDPICRGMRRRFQGFFTLLLLGVAAVALVAG